LPEPLNSFNSISLGASSSINNNAYFNIENLTGTPEEIYAAILNPSNWVISEAQQLWTPSTWSINVLSSAKKVINHDFEIFPNPTNNLIQIKTIGNWDNFSLCNAQGKFFFKNESITQSIDIQSLVSGVYFIHLGKIDGSASLKAKIIKQ
jgi:hypothetical protein